MVPEGEAERSRVVHASILICCFLYAAVVLRTAWMSDDAYITFRTVDHFTSGLGMRWNLAERVQTFTHPLWFFTVSALYWLTHEAYYTVLALSIVLSLATALLLGFGLARTPSSAILALLLLTFSKAFTDYSTSGLENPLTHLLLAVGLTLYLTGKTNPRTLMSLGLVACLMVLNRMDTALLIVPCLLVAAARVPPRVALRTLALCTLPFVFWEAFSLFYYGFLFPNTAYAKLNTGIDSSLLAAQGLTYLANALRLDPITPVTLALAILLPLVMGPKRLLPISFGIVLYLLYTIKVGGDFMSGRFLAAPLLMAAVILAQQDFRYPKLPWFATGMAMLLLARAAPNPPLTSGLEYGAGSERRIDANGIADERAFYYRNFGLLRARSHAPWPAIDPSQKDPPRHRAGIIVHRNVGIMGYYATPPSVHILDQLALCDPLLARLPVLGPWRIGHFLRPIPRGYVATLAHGENVIEDPGLAAYYKHLAQVTRGPLFSLDRLHTLVALNLGTYDGLLEAYTTPCDGALLFENSDFEAGDLSHWHPVGEALRLQPTLADNPKVREAASPALPQGRHWIGTFERYTGEGHQTPGSTRGDFPQGTLLSESFTVRKKRIAFLIGGGSDLESEYVALVIDGARVRVATGQDDESLQRVVWEVGSFVGKTAAIAIVDRASGAWGHINADSFHYACSKEGVR